MSIFPQGYFIISNVFSGKVLDVESGSKEVSFFTYLSETPTNRAFSLAPR